MSDVEGARREIQHWDRHAGWDRGSARAAHADAIYDLEADSTTTPPSALAREPIERMGTGGPPTALARLRQRFA